MNKSQNKVFVATSLDGYIADKNGYIDWLQSIPNPKQIDMGYSDFMNDIDAVVMGRNTFETVRGMDIPWPYDKFVFVLSRRQNIVPGKLRGRVELINGPLQEVIKRIHDRGYHRLYIDGGVTIQSFLKENLIDEITITIIPVLLGAGIPLFGHLEKPIMFKCAETKIYLDGLVQNRFVLASND